MPLKLQGSGSSPRLVHGMLYAARNGCGDALRKYSPPTGGLAKLVLAVTQGHLIQTVTAISRCFAGWMLKQETPFLLPVLLAAAAILAASPDCSAQLHYKVLHGFDCSTEGCEPLGALALGKAEKFYGTASAGGNEGGECPAYGCGTVFGIAQSSKPPYGWSTPTIHRFTAIGEGLDPYGGVTLDASDAMFGTTPYGPGQYTGTVFEIAPGSASQSSWLSADLYNFDFNGDDPDGDYPLAPVTLGSGEAIYGTTEFGGNGIGTVFRVVPSSIGWAETIIYAFCTFPTCNADGAQPIGGVVFDAEGNLYGATPYGGNGYGVVYELMPTPSGQWNEKILWTFSGGTDGGYPGCDLIFDKQGNLYSTATGGGPYEDGVVFKLTPDGQGGWQESVIYGFPDAQNGGVPFSRLTMDAAGNMYGVSKGGINACDSGCGVVYRLHPESNGQWTYAVLHKFAGPPNDGAEPWAGVTLDGKGNLFGTTAFGGTYNQGTVYEISP